MTGLIAAEVRKLTSVRSTLILTLIGWFLAVTSTMPIVISSFEPFRGTSQQVADAVAGAGGNSIIVLVVGLLSMTTEFRHGTIGRTLQLVPSRTRVLFAKLAAGSVYATVFFLGALVLIAVVVVGAVLIQDVSFAVDGAAFEKAWQGLVGAILTVLLGVAFGALVRAQVVAIVVALVWIFVVENLFAALWPQVGRWFPFQALNGLFIPESAAGQLPDGMFVPLAGLTALAVFSAWVVAFGVAAVVLLRTRDV